MTDTGRGSDRTTGPSWSVDDLADLHAGVLDDDTAAALWPRVNADPQARAVITALETTTADLATLASEPSAPIPVHVADGIDAALRQEQQYHRDTVVTLDAARKRRRKRVGWSVGGLTAAAAIIAALAITVPNFQDSEPGIAEPEAPSASIGADRPPLALSSDNPESALGDINGQHDLGPFANEQEINACLDANGVESEGSSVGIRPVTVDDRDGVAVLYTTGELAEFRLVVVDSDCDENDSDLLMDKIIGGTGG